MLLDSEEAHLSLDAALTTDDPYGSLGVEPLINAATTLTLLGGSLMEPDVVAAMGAAAKQYVRLDELQIAASGRIAQLTGNEAAHVTAGCAAAVVLATIATIVKGEPQLLLGPPQDEGLGVEVVVDRSHDIQYLPAIALGGGRVVWIGSEGKTKPEELEEAIRDETAAVFYVAGQNREGIALSLQETIEIAHKAGVPVIVDAAAQLPPVENLWRFTTQMGADLALFSGGKGLHGPQASGLLVGRSRYVEAARANASPAPGIARALKVGKEEIVGLVRAIELYLERDHIAEKRLNREVCEGWVETLNGASGITAEICESNEAGQPSPRVRLTFDVSNGGVDAIEVEHGLWNHSPRIAILPDTTDSFYITPDTLTPGEAGVVARAIESVSIRLRGRAPA